MADARRLDLDEHFARLRAFQIDLDDLQRLPGFEGDGGAGFHLGLLTSGVEALDIAARRKRPRPHNRAAWKAMWSAMKVAMKK